MSEHPTPQGRLGSPAAIVVGLLVAILAAALVVFVLQTPDNRDEAPPDSTDSSARAQPERDEPAPPTADETDGEQEHTALSADDSATGREDTDNDEVDDESGDESADIPSPAAKDSDFQSALDDIRSLEREARFFEGLKKLDELKDVAAGDRGRMRAISRLVSRLRRHRARAGTALSQLPKLGSERPEVRRAAAERILSSGEVAFILLRKQAREAQGQALQTTLDVLVAQRDWQALSSILERILQQPDEADLSPLLEAARLLVEEVPVEERERFAAQFGDLYQWVRADTDFSRREGAGLLLQTRQDWFDAPPTALNGFLRAPEAAVFLESYVRLAAAADDTAIVEWARRQMSALGVRRPSLVGWWRFDQPDQTRVADWSGNGHPAVVEGATFVQGRSGHALRFDGKDGFARIQDSQELRGGVGARITVSVLFKLDNPNRFNPLVEKQWDGTQGDWGLYANGGSIAYYGEEGGGDYHLSGGTVQAHTWHHAALVLEQDESRARVALFLDGKKVAEERPNDIVSSSAPGDVTLGARYYNNREAKGKAQAVIDEVLVFDRAFDDEDVLQLTAGTGVYQREQTGTHEAATELAKLLPAAETDLRVRILVDALEQTWRSAPDDNRAAYRPSVRTLAEWTRQGDFADLADYRKLSPLFWLVETWFGGKPEHVDAWLPAEGLLGTLRERLAQAAASENETLQAWAKNYALPTEE